MFVPVLGAPLLHAPVLRYDLLGWLKGPIDGGMTFRGRRVLGDNKTWRGAVVMICGIVGASLLLSLWPWFWSKLPDDVQDAGPLVVGVLVGIGTVAGEFPNSFLKRQLDVAPGSRRRSALGVGLSIFDQGDFVIGIWIAFLPVWVMTPLEALVAFVAVVLVHLAINVIGYRIGARSSML